MKLTAKYAEHFLEKCPVLEDCCSKYQCSATFVWERGHGEPDHAVIEEVFVHSVTTRLYGVDCEVLEPKGGWPSALEDYCKAQLEGMEKFQDAARFKVAELS